MRRWYSILAIGFLNAVLLLLLVNLVLYAVISVRKPPSPTQDYGSERIMQAYPGWRKEDVDLLLRETWGDDVGFEYDPFTGFRNKPFARKTKYVHIDSAGFRISKRQAAWPPSPENFTVFVFGGSTTFGLGLPDDETIASHLQECGAVDGKTIAVYNFGRTWYYSSQESILFQQLLKKGYIPQVAIFIDGLNEFNSWGPDEPGNASQVRTFMAGGPTPGPLDQLPMVKAAHWLGSRTLPHRHMKLDYTDRAVLESVVNRWLANKKITQAAAAVFGSELSSCGSRCLLTSTIFVTTFLGIPTSGTPRAGPEAATVTKSWKRCGSRENWAPTCCGLQTCSRTGTRIFTLTSGTITLCSRKTSPSRSVPTSATARRRLLIQ